MPALLLNSIVLEHTNYKTVSETILTQLLKYEIPFSKISAFVTDNAGYMHKAWNRSLKGTLLNAVHVTCVAHLLNLLCEVWQKEFEAVNQLVVAVKRGFSACPSRKARFRQYLHSQGSPNSLPPKPIKTRWNTWFKAVLYHADHLEDYIDFFSEEGEISSSLAPSEIVSLSTNGGIKADLACVKKYAPRLMESLTSYETSEVRAHVVVKDLKILSEWLELSSESETNTRAKRALQMSNKKLRSYTSETSTVRFRQPATNFFIACQVFDLDYVRIVNVDPNSIFENIPRKQTIFLSSVNDFTEFDNPVDFWISAGKRFPKLSQIALTCLSVPVNSVAAERSFSLYNDVLRNDRRRIAEKNLPTYNLLFQNSESL